MSWSAPTLPRWSTSLDEAEYRAMPALNYSTLKPGLDSPAHMRHAIDNPREASDAMRLGTAVHVAALQPALFAERYAIMPAVDRRTKAGKAEAEAFDADHADKDILRDTEAASCRAMLLAIHANPAARAAVRKPGLSEVACNWVRNGAECKCRIDRVVKGWGIVDVKTVRDASPRFFETEISNRQYHLQAAMYLDGARACGLVGPDAVYCIVAVSNTEPHLAAVYHIDDHALRAGAWEMDMLIEMHRHCTETGVWPGYSDQVESIGLPAWRRRLYDGMMF